MCEYSPARRKMLCVMSEEYLFSQVFFDVRVSLFWIPTSASPTLLVAMCGLACLTMESASKSDRKLGMIKALGARETTSRSSLIGSLWRHRDSLPSQCHTPTDKGLHSRVVGGCVREGCVREECERVYERRV